MRGALRENSQGLAQARPGIFSSLRSVGERCGPIRGGSTRKSLWPPHRLRSPLEWGTLCRTESLGQACPPRSPLAHESPWRRQGPGPGAGSPSGDAALRGHPRRHRGVRRRGRSVHPHAAPLGAWGRLG